MMQFKIDTKSNHVHIKVANTELNDKMADEITLLCARMVDHEPNNLIFEFENPISMSPSFPDKLASIQSEVYETERSIVFTGLSIEMQDLCRKSEYGDVLNVTPTLIEAVDIVSMEVLERDMLRELDDEQ